VLGVATPSPGRLLASVIVTDPPGCDVRRTVNVAAPPASVVWRPEVGETATPWLAAIAAAGWRAPRSSAAATCTMTISRKACPRVAGPRNTGASTGRDRRTGSLESNDDTRSLPWGGDGRGVVALWRCASAPGVGGRHSSGG